jgi:Raf kinase inhibitor-like YbhB/YbcL family protein
MKLLSSTILSRVGLVLGLATFVSPAGCREGEQKMTLQVTSTAFTEGQPIPKKYTGEGTDVSPPLAWSGVPAAAKELVLICDDPDAPAGTWVHWVIYKIPADVKGLPEGVSRKAKPKEPAGAVQGKNSWGEGENIGYRGPMPPPGHGVHHYHFKLYALDAPLEAEPGWDKKAVLEKLKGHVLAQGALMGTYERKK